MKTKIYTIIKFATAKVIILASAFLAYYLINTLTVAKTNSPLLALLITLLWAYLSSLILFAFVHNPKENKKSAYSKSH